jgi:hypothetical protein
MHYQRVDTLGFLWWYYPHRYRNFRKYMTTGQILDNPETSVYHFRPIPLHSQMLNRSRIESFLYPFHTELMIRPGTHSPIPIPVHVIIASSLKNSYPVFSHARSWHHRTDWHVVAHYCSNYFDPTLATTISTTSIVSIYVFYHIMDFTINHIPQCPSTINTHQPQSSAPHNPSAKLGCTFSYRSSVYLLTITVTYAVDRDGRSLCC